MKGYLLVEGHGEVEAAGNLVARATRALGAPLAWDRPRRWKNLHLRVGFEKGANYIRTRGDADALLILRDEDDACPRERGPEMADWLRALDLPFPAAVVLLHPEYEVLFLPCLDRMAGQLLGSGPAARPGLRADARWIGPWESHRGIKEWLSARMPPARSYKPTQDQLPLTRLIDLPTLRRADVPCFGTLERAIAFLGANAGSVGVYPPEIALPPARPRGGTD